MRAGIGESRSSWRRHYLLSLDHRITCSCWTTVQQSARRIVVCRGVIGQWGRAVLSSTHQGGLRKNATETALKPITQARITRPTTTIRVTFTVSLPERFWLLSLMTALLVGWRFKSSIEQSMWKRIGQAADSSLASWPVSPAFSGTGLCLII